MTIPYLIEDVLEAIFDFVHEKTSKPTSESQATFAALSLVSRRFLPLARARLYYRPIHTDHKPPRSTATQLISSLEANGGSLGRLVKSLEGLSFWMAPLCKVRNSYHLDLLKACPNINSLQISLSTGIELAAIQSALSATHGITRLILAVYDSVEEEEESESVPEDGDVGAELWGEELVHETLKIPSFQKVTDLGFYLHNLLPSNVATPSVTLPITKFCLKGGYSKLAVVTQFLPISMHSVEAIEIALMRPSTSEVTQVLTFLGGGTRRISFEYAKLTVAPEWGLLKLYRLQFSRPLSLQHLISEIPVDSLLRFPCLTHLTFTNSRGPSVALLQALMSSSPLIRSLDFRTSYWVTTATIPSETSDEAYYKIVFPEAQICDVLLQFEHLDKIHLGFIPFAPSGNPIPLLTSRLESRNVELKWEGCLMR